MDSLKTVGRKSRGKRNDCKIKKADRIRRCTASSVIVAGPSWMKKNARKKFFIDKVTGICYCKNGNT